MIIKNENKFDHFFQTYGQLHNLDWLLLKSQVKAESLFNPQAVSPVGAKGLSQFMPLTWKEWGEGDVFDPEQNIKAQAKYMNWLRGMVQKKLLLKDDWLRWALASYNWGIGRVVGYKNNLGVLQKSRQNFPDAEKMLPKETQGYVKRIIKYYDEYRLPKNA